MADKVTLGGDRLGSGEKIQVERHNYMMNSFNLSQDWKSSMAPGIIYPCLKLLGTNHGTFDINVEHLVRTLPTQGPLLGSFKMQVDFFNVPFRLYQGLLHNNPTDIGMHMDQVHLPKLLFQTIDGKTAPRVIGSNDDDIQVNVSALEKYLGISGIGHVANYTTTNSIAKRKLQCIPELAYYDIFKCYYANKQEDNAYVITPGSVREAKPDNVKMLMLWNGKYEELTPESYTMIKQNNIVNDLYIKITGKNFTNIEEQVEIIIKGYPSQSELIKTIKEFKEVEYIKVTDKSENKIEFQIGLQEFNKIISDQDMDIQDTAINFQIYSIESDNTKYTSDIKLSPFALKNIDKMRNKLLKCNELGDEFIIDGEHTEDVNTWGSDSGVDGTGLPYAALSKKTSRGITWNAFAQNGLVVKTYQSDIFNNWLNSETIDGIDGVRARTAVDTSGGSFTQDDLILHEKLFNLLNRIAIGDGSYWDWQEANYGEGVAKITETPIYVGGMSAEVFFDEIISSSETNIDGEISPLGTLGGRGRTAGQKGGHSIHCKTEEPGYIMAMVSLTPRICQTQGNDWDRTELHTMDDLHKPALDGIGFQDLPVEWMAWWNTVLRQNVAEILHRDSAGKQTAWLHYQTAVDKAYGDFAKQEGYNFMVLSRNYEHSEDSPYAVEDLTTYVDPSKCNYAFAKTDLASQNFWVQLNFDIVARRKMGATQLPNL